MSVINDLSTDQRVHRHCSLLTELGYDVLLIGRVTATSTPLEKREYRTYRMRLPFERGPLFYASYSIALFVQLLFRRSGLLFPNDLDTLMPNFLISKLKRTPLIYDSHEFFTEVPELINRPRVQDFWVSLEKWILPKLDSMITVNQSIAELFRQKYGVSMKVVRNIPKFDQDIPVKTRSELGLPEDKKLVILQGSGINIDRGAEEVVEAMKMVDGAVLLILGSGDVIGHLKKQVEVEGLNEKVIFKDRMSYTDMMTHTCLADLGLTLDKDININYRFSLPNKLFDYIHAGIPVLGSNLKEVRNVIEQYQVGEVVEEVQPKVLARKITEMLSSSKIESWKMNCQKAKAELNWNKESVVLREMVQLLGE